jgi:hypothetical protein
MEEDLKRVWEVHQLEDQETRVGDSAFLIVLEGKRLGHGIPVRMTCEDNA